MSRSRPAEHFRRLYQAKDDPWEFATSAYEQGKYRHTLQTLGERRFCSGLEVGCSVGVLTQLLAARCERLLGIDIAAEPLVSARRRCAQGAVRFLQMQVPDEWPAERFDLIVLSEVLYFLSLNDIARCARHVVRSLLPGGVVLLVNWLGRSDDPVSGDEAADRFIAASALPVARQDRAEQYRLDVLQA